MPRREVLFEGLTGDEILSLAPEAVDELIVIGEPSSFESVRQRSWDPLERLRIASS